MGALVTLDLPDDSPVQDLPWLITVGPINDDDEWEPVVCGPYERPHALALAEAVVADDDLLAVVEPLLPLVDVEAIRHEIDLARRAAESEFAADADEADASDPGDGGPEDDVWDGGRPGGGAPDGPEGWRRIRSATPPGPDDVRAGFARIAAKLTAAR